MPPSSWPSWYRSAIKMASARAIADHAAAPGGGEPRANNPRQGNYRSQTMAGQSPFVRTATLTRYKQVLARAQVASAPPGGQALEDTQEQSRGTFASMAQYKRLVLKAQDARTCREARGKASYRACHQRLRSAPTGHTMRVTGAQRMAKAGLALEVIKAFGRWGVASRWRNTQGTR